jgi:CelD/BcsL family acetyltransferase involved in cellulose biosynthesis
MALLTNPAVDTDIELLQGEAAHRILEDCEFVGRWNELFQRCTWSMAYQSVDYAMAWYKCYGDLYEPLLIRRYSEDGSLAGLLALGVSKQDGELVSVGAPHAEYAAWLSGPPAPERFIEEALDALSTDYPAASLTFRYLAPGAPIEWASSGGRWASRCVVVEVDRPEMELNLETIRKSLSKRNNRNRLSRLRRYGQLKFCRLTDVDALASVLDAIFLQHDLRRIAVYGRQPFRSDARTRDFYLELMRSGRLHATISTIDKQIVAAIIAICGRETVHLELLCHSPRFSAESPGKLHLLNLAQQLVTEGFKYIDMTPGELLWKDRSATNHNSVHEIVVAFSRRGLLKVQTQVVAKHRTKRFVKPLLTWLRVEPRVIKDTVRQLKDEGLQGFVGKRIRAAFGSLAGSDEIKTYHFEGFNGFATDNDLAIKMDALEDLFLLEEKSIGVKRTFLRRAYERLCARESIFTHTEGDRLMGLCWAKAIESDFENDDVVSPLCFLLHDPYYHSSADREDMCLAFAKSIARTCRSQHPKRPLELWARNSDRDLTAALDELLREEFPDSKTAALSIQ